MNRFYFKFYLEVAVNVHYSLTLSLVVSAYIVINYIDIFNLIFGIVVKNLFIPEAVIAGISQNSNIVQNYARVYYFACGLWCVMQNTMTCKAAKLHFEEAKCTLHDVPSELMGDVIFFGFGSRSRVRSWSKHTSLRREARVTQHIRIVRNLLS